MLTLFCGISGSSILELQRWWVLKSKNFSQEPTYILKEIFFKKTFDELRFVKKCQNRTFKANFGCQKLVRYFQKRSAKNINLGDHNLVKTLLSKITPDF